MTKIKKLQAKLLAHKTALVFMGVALLVGLASVSVAAGFSWKSVESKVASLIAEKVSVPLVVEEEEPAVGAVSSPMLPGPAFGIGKDWQFSVSADLTDATTTFAFATPFRKATSTASDIVVEDLGRLGLTGATTTVEVVRINFTSSTPSAYEVGCGSSSNKFATSTSAHTSLAILTSGSIAAARGNVTVENDLQTTEGADVNGGTVEKIMIGPNQPYIVCKVSTAAANEWTGADGVSPGKIVIRFAKVQ